MDISECYDLFMLCRVGQTKPREHPLLTQALLCPGMLPSRTQMEGTPKHGAYVPEVRQAADSISVVFKASGKVKRGKIETQVALDLECQ